MGFAVLLLRSTSKLDAYSQLPSEAPEKAAALSQRGFDESGLRFSRFADKSHALSFLIEFTPPGFV